MPNHQPVRGKREYHWYAYARKRCRAASALAGILICRQNVGQVA